MLKPRNVFLKILRDTSLSCVGQQPTFTFPLKISSTKQVLCWEHAETHVSMFCRYGFFHLTPLMSLVLSLSGFSVKSTPVHSKLVRDLCFCFYLVSIIDTHLFFVWLCMYLCNVFVICVHMCVCPYKQAYACPSAYIKVKEKAYYRALVLKLKLRLFASEASKFTCRDFSLTLSYNTLLY